jgi:hypothetical protein
MGGYRGVEEEKNKGGQEDGARPCDHRLDGEDKAFRGLTGGASGEAAAKGDKKDDTERDGAKQLRVDMHRFFFFLFARFSSFYLLAVFLYVRCLLIDFLF